MSALPFKKPPPLTLLWMSLLFGLTTLTALLAPTEASTFLLKNLGFSASSVFEYFRFWTTLSFSFIDEVAIRSHRYFGMIMSLLMIYWFAKPLEERWGARRFAFFYILTSLAASGSILLLSLVSSRFSSVSASPSAITTAFVFAFSLTHRYKDLNLFGLLAIKGIHLMWMGCAMILMDAIFISPVIIVPRAAAAGMAVIIVMGLWKKNFLKLAWDWLLVKLHMRKAPKLTLVPPPNAPKKPHKYDIN